MCVIADFFAWAYAVLPLLLVLNVILPLLVHTHASCVHAALLNHTTVGVFACPVITGHVAHVDVACATPLYVSGIVLLTLVALIVLLFALKFIVNVNAVFLLWA